ncbi:MAG: DUF2993 domain-containing protein [Actinomycetota bacterium]
MTGSAGKRRGCLLALLVALIVFAAVSLFLEFYIPMKVADFYAARIKTSLKLQRKPEITIDMHPFLYKLAIGEVDRVTFSAEDVSIPERPAVSKIDAEVKGIRFNLLEIIKMRQPAAIKRIDEGSARIVLSEKAVNDFMAWQLAGSTIKLEEDGLWYVTSLSYIGAGTTMNAPGDITVITGDTVAFQPDIDRIAVLPLSQEEKDYLAGALAVKYRIDEMPEGVSLKKITVEAVRIIIDCEFTGTNLLKMGSV